MDQKSVQNLHQPFLREVEGSDTAVLLVHGILGSPNQFEAIAQKLYAAGCTVSAILLPGHGGSARDFVEAKARDWQRAVDEAAAQLRERYRHVFLLGHSMGGLLILGEAVRYGTDGLILFSTPMRIRIGLRSALTSLKVLWGDPDRDDNRIGAYRRAFSVQAGSLWEHLCWAATYGELMRLIKTTRRGLGQVTQPVLIIQSKRDETVAWRSAEIFKRELARALTVDVRMLSRSEHSYHHPDEAEAINKAICDFVVGKPADNAHAQTSPDVKDA